MQFGGTCDQLLKSGAHRRGASALPSQHSARHSSAVPGYATAGQLGLCVANLGLCSAVT